MVIGHAVIDVTSGQGHTAGTLCPMSFRRFSVDEAGNERVTFESDQAKPYEMRRPKGLSEHAVIRRFQKGKPRYRHVGGLLVMMRKASSSS